LYTRRERWRGSRRSDGLGQWVTAASRCLRRKHLTWFACFRAGNVDGLGQWVTAAARCLRPNNRPKTGPCFYCLPPADRRKQHTDIYMHHHYATTSATTLAQVPAWWGKNIDASGVARGPCSTCRNCECFRADHRQPSVCGRCGHAALKHTDISDNPYLNSIGSASPAVRPKTTSFWPNKIGQLTCLLSSQFNPILEDLLAFGAAAVHASWMQSTALYRRFREDARLLLPLPRTPAQRPWWCVHLLHSFSILVLLLVFFCGFLFLDFCCWGGLKRLSKRSNWRCRWVE
jgi:hypothetical protein